MANATSFLLLLLLAACFFYTKYMNVPERDLDLPDLLFDLAVAFEDSLSTSDTVADEPLGGETRPTIQCSCECSLLASHCDPFTFRASRTSSSWLRLAGATPGAWAAASPTPTEHGCMAPTAWLPIGGPNGGCRRLPCNERMTRSVVLGPRVRIAGVGRPSNNQGGLRGFSTSMTHVEREDPLDQEEIWRFCAHWLAALSAVIAPGPASLLGSRELRRPGAGPESMVLRLNGATWHYVSTRERCWSLTWAPFETTEEPADTPGRRGEHSETNTRA